MTCEDMYNGVLALIHQLKTPGTRFYPNEYAAIDILNRVSNLIETNKIRLIEDCKSRERLGTSENPFGPLAVDESIRYGTWDIPP